MGYSPFLKHKFTPQSNTLDEAMGSRRLELDPVEINEIIRNESYSGGRDARGNIDALLSLYIKFTKSFDSTNCAWLLDSIKVLSREFSSETFCNSIIPVCAKIAEQSLVKCRGKHMKILDAVKVCGALSEIGVRDSSLFRKISDEICRYERVAHNHAASIVDSYARAMLSPLKLFDHIALSALRQADSLSLLDMSYILGGFGLAGFKHERFGVIMADRLHELLEGLKPGCGQKQLTFSRICHGYAMEEEYLARAVWEAVVPKYVKIFEGIGIEYKVANHLYHIGLAVGANPEEYLPSTAFQMDTPKLFRDEGTIVTEQLDKLKDEMDLKYVRGYPLADYYINYMISVRSGAAEAKIAFDWDAEDSVYDPYQDSYHPSGREIIRAAVLDRYGVKPLSIRKKDWALLQPHEQYETLKVHINSFLGITGSSGTLEMTA